MQVSAVGLQPLNLCQHVAVVEVLLRELLLGLGHVGLGIGDFLLQSGHGGIAVAQECLVRLLSLLLPLDSLLLDLLGILDQRLHQRQDPNVALVLPPGLEARRGRGHRRARLLALQQGRLAVDPLQHLHSLPDQGLGGALIADILLVRGVLLFTSLTSLLQGQPRAGNLSAVGCDPVLKLCNGSFQIRDGGLVILVLAILDRVLLLVLVELLVAIVVLLHLLSGLLLQLYHHVINGLLHLREIVQLHLRSQGLHHTVPRPDSGLQQCLCCSHTGVTASRASLHGSDLKETHGSMGQLASGILRQNLDGLPDCLDLLVATELTLRKLLISILALQVQVRQESRVRTQGVLHVIQILLGVGQALVGVREFRLLVGDVVLGSADLFLLGRLHALVVLLGGRLLLSRRFQISLESLQHVIEDPKNLRRLRGIRLVTSRLLQEGGQPATLVLRHVSHNLTLLSHDLLHHISHSGQRAL
mmetsp:Transcript_45278/g.111184  ORF Transcript_45278/g.111184 Transcript_45278/m.111184 type:complete len:473 (-) Transcript_45278:532-1950(-)